jgi:hypothetical protein
MPLHALAQTPNPPAAATSEQLLKSEELDSLVAPIALYPDPLLAEVLMASTYPLEVVQAERWATKNKSLKGDRLKAEVDKQPWDQSVKSLVATPSVLEMMSANLEWTQKLGDALLAQQAEVMDAIQRLRSKAMANNKLTTTKEQTVTVKQQENKQVIVIEPADPNTLYVPYYDPAVVYGGWPYPAYPPYYFQPPAYIATGVIAAGLAFGAGYALGRWAWGGNYWGGGMYWRGSGINVNRPVNINNIGNRWEHRPEHRGGVRYNNPQLQQKFGSRGGGQALRGGEGGQGLRKGLGAQRRVEQPIAKNRASQGANRPRHGKAAGKVHPRRPASLGPQRGRASLGHRGGIRRAGIAPRGGGPRFGHGSFGGGYRGFAGYRRGFAGGHGGFAAAGRGGFRGGRGGGRRSDIRLKHGITLLGRLDNGLGFYRFVYSGGKKVYVGVMAQEVERVVPEAVTRGPDGYLRVYYDRLGLKFETCDHWIASGAQIPGVRRNQD